MAYASKTATQQIVELSNTPAPGFTAAHPGSKVGQGKVLGTVAILHERQHRPSLHQLAIIDFRGYGLVV
jgi:hypothetical protein